MQDKLLGVPPQMEVLQQIAQMQDRIQVPNVMSSFTGDSPIIVAQPYNN